MGVANTRTDVIDVAVFARRYFSSKKQWKCIISGFWAIYIPTLVFLLFFTHLSGGLNLIYNIKILKKGLFHNYIDIVLYRVYGLTISFW